MKITIAIPARYGSTRFPGKPLAMIGDKSMLQRVVELAKETVKEFAEMEEYLTINIFVTTDDKRIAEHASVLGVPYIMTPESCKTGSDRVLAAIRQLDQWPDFVINLQGDVPFLPVSVLRDLIQSIIDKPNAQVVTPVHRLSWDDLDALREAKKDSPHSGTTAVLSQSAQNEHPEKMRQALWFSKSILPVIRNEETVRKEMKQSPVYQHMGLYGFRTDVLETFCKLPSGVCEEMEGLEQLRLLEHGVPVQCVIVHPGEGLARAGIDTPEDLARAETFLSTVEDAA